MATDFNKNAVGLTGGILPSTTDTPGDVRTRVETEADILSIPKPFVGMIVYVVDTGERFEVLSLKDKKAGLSTIKNGAVKEYRKIEFASDDGYATDEELNQAQTDIDALQAAIAKLLNPYVAPQVNFEVICTPSQEVIEKGYVVNVAKLRVSIVKGSEDITKVAFIVDGVEVAILEEGVAEGGVIEHAFDVAIQLEDNITEDYFKVEIQDSSNNIIGVNGKAINFVCPFYFGVINENEEITSNKIKELVKVVEVKGDKMYSYSTNNQHMIIAYPKEYGELAKVIDANGFNLKASFKKQEILVDCFDEQVHEYYMYKNGASTVSDYEIIFKF